MRSLLNLRSAAGQVFVLQVVIVVLLVAAAVTALVLDAERDSWRDARRQSLTAAETFANAPGTAEALMSKDPTAVLQPRTEAARKRSGVDFIVVTNTKGIRYTHPDPSLIGKKFVGNIQPSLAGRVTIERIEGRLHGARVQAVQAVVPVTTPDGSVVGLVGAGLRRPRVVGTVDEQLPIMLGAGAAALAVSAAGTALVSRRLLRQTHGLGPAEMTRMYEHHDTVLHAVREGVLIIDARRRLLLANDEARRLLDLPDDVERRQVEELGLSEETARLLASTEPLTDAVHLAADRLLLVNRRPTAPPGGQTGSVVTLRDTTELAAVTGRAEMARERLKLLYDAGVRLSTTLDVAGTARQLSEVVVPGFADGATVDLLDMVMSGQEPARETGQAMRHVAVSGSREVSALFPVGDLVTRAMPPPTRIPATGRAEPDSDLSAAHQRQEQGPYGTRKALDHGLHSLVTAPLQARGVVLGCVNFFRTGESPPFDEDDVSFAEELAARAAVAIDNARRFTREHTLAVTLQRSLLPRGLPEQNALEVAWRYLPAQAGVGGDWFDVIPLPGARVALVVGDVVGHGLHAAATMGRLRTAVHNFSALDLSPDELLAHLDDLVTRIDNEEATDRDPEDTEHKGVTGATCLYAIYDPVTGHCTIARAGHPGPAVVRPDGSVMYPEVPVSPPLGLSGHPFETADLWLPENSRLVLYTDGLIEGRHRNIDTGLGLLHRSLVAAAGGTPEEICQAVVDTALLPHASDDVALLVARTRLLPPSRVAEWDVPSDPAAVAPVRAECGARLRAWGLEEIGFATELILSELITNAIRHGRPPVKVRLLHDRGLICEVSDASSTSPHLRRAATTDEGGRGLYLVAQFAQRWGTRYTPRGKVIWSEQLPHDNSAAADDTMSDTLADVLLSQFDDAGDDDRSRPAGG
ncbi:histidine kinase [Streptomyces viridochromogenes]|uniref:Histidine kinase n=1 Tax=Streptomyces viridochromogenes TaxID=1938 RepID=A0A0J8C6A2_STRVR|nr:histidine kinase [Streptomyces viridochromogenes]KOG24442.1 histidine kinase [Streptomyces viridochromogenes]KOG25548.1 histidine kinase [Streptomyces viridochromogenes]